MKDDRYFLDARHSPSYGARWDPEATPLHARNILPLGVRLGIPRVVLLRVNTQAPSLARSPSGPAADLWQARHRVPAQAKMIIWARWRSLKGAGMPNLRQARTPPPLGLIRLRARRSMFIAGSVVTEPPGTSGCRSSLLLCLGISTFGGRGMDSCRTSPTPHRRAASHLTKHLRS